MGVVGILCAVLGFAVVGSGYGYHRMAGETMSPELPSGTGLWTERVRPADVRRGEVYTVDSPWTLQGTVVQRAMALGGDRIACANGQFSLNGKPVDEPPARQTHTCYLDFDVTVPPGRAFLMGDRRADTFDSRINLNDQQGTVDLAKVGERVVWHNGAGDEALPGKLAGALVLGAVGLLLAVVGLIAAIILAVRGRAARPLGLEPPATF
ncbi:signal peptidase I [Kitasatospora sp. NPDC058048]|uniref:signal peptidase I n=1 Tax=Kitasatospora sp. NPDC058048 TaxID=3346313 RepID=UPI0036D81046